MYGKRLVLVELVEYCRQEVFNLLQHGTPTGLAEDLKDVLNDDVRLTAQQQKLMCSSENGVSVPTLLRFIVSYSICKHISFVHGGTVFKR